MTEIERLAKVMSDAAWDAGPFDAKAGVRAILQAMREPSESFVTQDGYIEVSPPDGSVNFRYHGSHAKWIWQAMIDLILAEPAP